MHCCYTVLFRDNNKEKLSTFSPEEIFVMYTLCSWLTESVDMEPLDMEDQTCDCHSCLFDTSLCVPVATEAFGNCLGFIVISIGCSSSCFLFHNFLP